MEAITIVVLLILIVLMIRRKKYFFNPVTIFSGTWIIIVFLANLKLYDMIEYDEKIIVMILLANLSFFIGNIPKKGIRCVIGTKKSTKRNKGNYYVYEYKINKPFVIFCMVVAFISIGVVLLSVIKLLLSGSSYSYIRDILFGYDTDATLVNSGVFMLFFTWIVSGIVYAFMPLALIEFFERKKFNSWAIYGLILAGVFTFATAGRAVIFVLVIQVIVLLKHYDYTIPKRIKRTVIMVAIGAIGMLFIISYFRTKSIVDKHVNSVYSYFCISVPLLSHWVEYVDANNIYTWGRATLYGVDSILNWILRFVGIQTPKYMLINEAVNLPQNNWLTIFHNPVSRYNAFCSALYYFYLDFRWIGIVVLSLLCGLVINNVFNLLKNAKDKKCMFYYLLIVQMLVLSFIKLQTSNPPYIFALLIINFAIKRVKIINQAKGEMIGK